MNVTLVASDGFLTLASSKPVYVILVVALFALGIGGRMLGVF